MFPSVLGVNEQKIDFIALNTGVAAMVSLRFTEKVGSFADDVSDLSLTLDLVLPLAQQSIDLDLLTT